MATFKQILVAGKTPIPQFIYGTAWKGNETGNCTLAALLQGFRALDSAPQATHYREEQIGVAIKSWREQNPKADTSRLFRQSKFTPIHDHHGGPMPFSEEDPPAVQVQKSFEQSLKHFGEDCTRLDAYVLHSPFSTIGETMGYYEAMESLVPDSVGYIGLCNVSLQTLEEVYERASIKPAIVQNDFRPEQGYDKELLDWCKERGIIYQAYSVLKGNLRLLATSLVGWLAQQKGITPPQALYLLVLSYWDGQICILNGTKNPETMAQDLAMLSDVGKLGPDILEGFEEELLRTEDTAWLSDTTH